LDCQRIFGMNVQQNDLHEGQLAGHHGG
jgi:hypothetical protein